MSSRSSFFTTYFLSKFFQKSLSFSLQSEPNFLSKKGLSLVNQPACLSPPFPDTLIRVETGHAGALPIRLVQGRRLGTALHFATTRASDCPWAGGAKWGQSPAIPQRVRRAGDCPHSAASSSILSEPPSSRNGGLSPDSIAYSSRACSALSISSMPAA